MIELVKPGGWIQIDEMDLEGEQKLPGMGGEVGRVIRALLRLLAFKGILLLI